MDPVTDDAQRVTPSTGWEDADPTDQDHFEAPDEPLCGNLLIDENTFDGWYGPPVTCGKPAGHDPNEGHETVVAWYDGAGSGGPVNEHLPEPCGATIHRGFGLTEDGQSAAGPIIGHCALAKGHELDRVPHQAGTP
jgi:hypothetical protein